MTASRASPDLGPPPFDIDARIDRLIEVCENPTWWPARHCEERSDEAIQRGLPWRGIASALAGLAMTDHSMGLAGGQGMHWRHLTPLVAVSLAFGLAAPARAADDGTDFRGAWARLARGGNSAAWDPTRPAALGQQAPLTAEYQAILEANVRDRAGGGQEYNPALSCLPAGMPRIMVAYDPLEIIVTPQIVYVRSDHLPELRRIYTDGRDWPEKIPPTFAGYSIGRWIAGDAGRTAALEVESRGMRGPRELDVDGLPLGRDNRTIVKERLTLDAVNHDLLHNQITVIDHAYTRPWTVLRDLRRLDDPKWVENNCGADNHYVVIGGENYFLSADRTLMPTKKDQPPPDLRNFR
jgi:hypothetical protein